MILIISINFTFYEKLRNMDQSSKPIRFSLLQDKVTLCLNISPNTDFLSAKIPILFYQFTTRNYLLTKLFIIPTMGSLRRQIYIYI